MTFTTLTDDSVTGVVSLIK